MLCPDYRRPADRRPTRAAGPGGRGGIEQLLVGLVPQRPFPSGCLDEPGAEGALGLREWCHAKATQIECLLGRVDDVIHLEVALSRPRSNIPGANPVAGETPDVAFVHIPLGGAAHDPLGQGLGHSHGVGDPYGRSRPQSLDSGNGPDQRHSVGREREDPVDRPFEAEPAQRGQEQVRSIPGTGEVGRREGQDRRSLPGSQAPLENSWIDRPRFVPVRAQTVALANLAEVHRPVLVAQDRVADELGLRGERRQGLGDRVLVLHRHERNRDTGEPAGERCPDPGRDDRGLRHDPPAAGSHGADASTGDVDLRDGAIPQETDSLVSRHGGHRVGAGHGSRGPVLRHVERPEDPIAQERQPLLGLISAEQRRLDAP